jgi:hypothetical protein
VRKTVSSLPREVRVKAPSYPAVNRRFSPATSLSCNVSISRSLWITCISSRGNFIAAGLSTVVAYLAANVTTSPECGRGRQVPRGRWRGHVTTDRRVSSSPISVRGFPSRAPHRSLVNTDHILLFNILTTYLGRKQTPQTTPRGPTHPRLDAGADSLLSLKTPRKTR